MNKIFNKITFLLGLSVLLFNAACSETDELLEVNYDRLFSVNEDNLSVNVISRTTLRISWRAVDNAEAYVIELFADDEEMLFEGDPNLTVETTYESPYLIEGLLGETIYSGRIKAISSEIADSKWVNFTFETDSENILNSIPASNLGISWVTLTWLAGAEVTSIVVETANGDWSTSHTLTADEIAAGEATIDGLSGNTTYTARLLNGEKTRGTATFTTNYDGTAITPTGDSATDTANLLEAIENTTDGIVAIQPGTLVIDGNIALTNSIALIAATGVQPVVQGAAFNLNSSITNLRFSNIIFDGNNQSRFLNINNTNLVLGDITIENCEILNYSAQLIYNNNASTLNSLTIVNSIVHDMGTSGDFIDFRAGPLRNLSITQSTFYNGIRDFIRMDDSSGSFGGSVDITVEQCTFYNITGAADKQKRIFYVRYTDNFIKFQNNIFTYSPVMYFTSESKTNTINFKNNYYYEADDCLQAGEYGTQWDTSGTVINPGFLDPENGDFTVTNNDLLYEGAGDPRWINIQ